MTHTSAAPRLRVVMYHNARVGVPLHAVIIPHGHGLWFEDPWTVACGAKLAPQDVKLFIPDRNGYFIPSGFSHLMLRQRGESPACYRSHHIPYGIHVHAPDRGFLFIDHLGFSFDFVDADGVRMEDAGPTNPVSC